MAGPGLASPTLPSDVGAKVADQLLLGARLADHLAVACAYPLPPTRQVSESLKGEKLAVGCAVEDHNVRLA